MLPNPLYSVQDAQQIGLLTTLPQSQTVIAQSPKGYVEDPDVLGQIRDGAQHFVETGQIWALLLGMFIGYWFSSLRRG